jgi:chorismate mutase/prephenate dehydratase
MKELNSKEHKLKILREKINIIDDKLISLIDERGELAKKIGKIKEDLGLEIFAPGREKIIIDRISERTTIFKKADIRAIWKEIIASCKSIQGFFEKVGYLGPKGTFSHQAALNFFPKGNNEFIAFSTIEKLFEGLDKGSVNYIIIPIENSLEGTLNDTLDNLVERDVFIRGEFELRIIQNLIGLKESDIENIKEIYSHPQAFNQSKLWIKSKLPNVELKPTNSTAEAVKKIKEMRIKENAAIGTKIASEIYNLQILKDSIEDNPNNFTRFVIVSKQDLEILPKEVKTTIIFVTKHIPGALYKVIKQFADANINLTKIESRPRRKGKWEYIFILDFEGSKEEPQIKEILEKLERMVIWYKYLGTYPKFRMS